MPELQPQLAELLRTCVHPASLRLRIVHIIEIDTKYRCREGDEEYNEAHRFARKYFLTDGSLVIQALLNRKLIAQRATGSLRIGDELDIHQFEVRKSQRRNGTGKIAFILIKDCHFILTSHSPVKLLKHSVHTPSPLKRKWEPEDVDSDDDIPASAQKSRDVSPTPVARIDGSMKRLEDSPIELDSIQMPVEDLPSDLDSVFDSDFELSPAILVSQSGKTGLGTGKKQKPDDFLHRLSPLKTPSRQLQKQSDTESEDEGFESFESAVATSSKRRKLLSHLTQAATTSTDLSEEIDTQKQLHMTAVPDTTSEHGSAYGEEVLTRDESSYDQDDAELYKDPYEDEDEELEEPQLTSLVHDDAQQHKDQRSRSPYRRFPTPYSWLDMEKPIIDDYSSTDGIDPENVLPSPTFHTLAELRQLAESNAVPSDTYSATTLAMIIWVSDRLVSTPGSEAPPRRLLKIVDPSVLPAPQPNNGEVVSSQVQHQTRFQGPITVAIHLDAEQFKPRSGTMTLFRGLVLQFSPGQDIILNAYESIDEYRFELPEITLDRPVPPPHPINDSHFESHWFMINPDRIRQLGYGSQLSYYNRWWNDRKRNG